MKDWEKRYNDMKNGNVKWLINLFNKIDELSIKREQKTIKKDELKELNEAIKMRDDYDKIKANLPKVANVLEYRAKLENDLTMIRQELVRRETLRENTNKIIMLETEMKQLMADSGRLEQELKTANDDKGKEKIKKELEGIKAKIDNNNREYGNISEIISKSPIGDKKLKDLPNDKLESKSVKLKSKISKCNMIGECLMAGKDWDQIDMRLEHWDDRRLTSDKKVAEKMQNASKETSTIEQEQSTDTKQPKREEAKGEEYDEKDEVPYSSLLEKKTKEPADEERIEIKPDQEVESDGDKRKLDKDETAVVPVSNFAKRHPKLAKFFNNMKNKFNNLLLAIAGVKKSDENEQELKNEQQTETRLIKLEGEEKKDGQREEVREEKPKEAQQPEIESSRTENDNFREYIRAVAEKGMKEADKEKLEAARQAIKDKQNINERDEGR